MALLHIRFEDIDESHLRRLLAAKVAENRDIEYKRQPYGDADADRAELLADLSSFANTNGGDVLIGIDAKEGVPLAIAPLSGSADAEILRMEDLVRAGLQPRIATRCKAIPLSGGGNVLLVRVPRSYNPPHRIVRNGKGNARFYARSSAGKYEPNVDELRALFTLAPTLAERIRDFRADRIAKIAAGAAPAPLQATDALVLHIVPLSAFGLGASVSLADINGEIHAFPPLGSQHPSYRQINFDGALMLSNAEAGKAQRAYVQVFRSGIVEAVAAGFANFTPQAGYPMMRVTKAEGLLLSNGLRYLKTLAEHGAPPPYAVVVSLLGVKGLTLGYGSPNGWPDEDDSVLLNRDQFHFGEVVLESVPTSQQAFAEAIRPVFEQLANTAGRATSPSYGPAGEYLHLFR